jgi:hypothetical protein
MWSLLGKKSSNSVQFVVAGTHLAEHCEVADAFVNHFQLVYNDISSGVFPFFSPYSRFLSLSPNCIILF